ncbi:MAG: aminoglycoside phosphotransferase family protein [Bacteriovoracaceae bacterium]|nr:aminoglycoside phosphotransferase family protein [Bacteriovoracaceae bacterium]
MMQAFSAKDILALDKAAYTKHFKSTDFGLALAKELALKHNYNEPLTRITEGSSLVFKIGTEHFLKITPPFYSGSIEAEFAATKTIGNQLPFSIPNILVNDQIEKWNYIITTHVKGQQAKNVCRIMTHENMKIFAKDIGKIIKDIHSIQSEGFERDFGPWSVYLENNLKNQEEIHLNRGNSPEWSKKISQFVNKYTKQLLSLGPAKLIHADLNHEHLMLEEMNNEWRVTGVLDFADSMNAPIEMEFILPIICFFKGKPDLQRLVWEGAQYHSTIAPDDYSNIMMALSLQNRFIAFHDWFDREIGKGAKSVEEIAAIIFPRIDL